MVAQTKSVQGACTNYDIMSTIERFDWYMQNVPGTQSVISLPGLAKMVNAGFNEGNRQVAPAAARPAGDGAESVTPIDTSQRPAEPRLHRDAGAGEHHRPAGRDHRAPGLGGEVLRRRNGDKLEFKLATGNMGVMAATNEAVDKAREMGEPRASSARCWLMCLITFRVVRATLCILIPLAIVSVLCEALMPMLDIGLKVSTLPVIALGVGVGVDYGIYLYDRIEARGRHGRCSRTLLRGAQGARHGDGVHRRDDDHRRRHLDALGAQVPGRHGHPARLHVLPEHARLDPAPASARRLPGR